MAAQPSPITPRLQHPVLDGVHEHAAPHLNVVVALPAEARPLVQHYRLVNIAPQHGLPFPVFTRAGSGLCLAVSGVGAEACAFAVAFLRGWQLGQQARALGVDAGSGTSEGEVASASSVVTDGANPCAWLNLGIAGHQSAEVGSLWVAHKVSGAAQTPAIESKTASWYPPQVWHWPCPTAALHTVAKPELNYPNADTLYDMEGLSFVRTAGRFATRELVQVAKVVSDNAAAPADRACLNAAAVAALVKGQLGAIERVIGILSQAAEHEQQLAHPPGGLHPCLQRWPFTRNQQHQLAHLLRTWQVRWPKRPVVPELKQYLQRLPGGRGNHPKAAAKAVLAYLEQEALRQEVAA